MNLMYICPDTDYSILKANIKISLYFFVDSSPQCITPFSENNYIQSVKKNLKALGWLKVKRYEFRAMNKSRKKYVCDGLMLYRKKDYSQFLYYFYSTTLPNREDHPIYQFIQKTDVVFFKDSRTTRTILHAISKMEQLPKCIVSSKYHFDQDNLTKDEKELFQSIKDWSILTDQTVADSTYEEIFQKFGFETKGDI